MLRLEIKMSVDKMLALAKTITTIQIKLPLNKEVYTQTMLMARHQKIAKLFDEEFWVTQCYAMPLNSSLFNLRSSLISFSFFTFFFFLLYLPSFISLHSSLKTYVQKNLKYCMY